ncbi:transmembrane protein 268-like isoform X5 [Scyliorhinus canicula]|uniref:transmembrane protein 268-like isoform X5 n=1 Tax=Scyliorhinus canicula TaxID=7830 RepID=UPI0018F38AEE|nr:transmembrane protein 268-like isoform X5 [Scyliorhinus canicula]
MACGGGLAARYHSSQAPHSGPAEQDGAGQWLKVLHNGQVMLVLTSDGYYWSRSFDMDACARRLEGLGFQLPAGGYRNQIESSLMDSEVRRYIFFNSRAFRLVLVVIFYLTAWGNIYSIFHRLSLNMPIFYLLVSLGATVATIIMILLLDRYTKKSELQKQLNHLYMIPGCAVTLDKEVQSQLVVTSEERPLLSNNSQNHKSKVIFSEVIDFVPQGTSEEVAHQLLITYSGVYVRLLVTDQLPPPPIVHHADQIPAPCLCQFIQNSVMNLKNTKEYNSCA